MANLDKAKASALGRLDKLMPGGPMPDMMAGPTDAVDTVDSPFGKPKPDMPTDTLGMGGSDLQQDDPETGYIEVPGGPTCGNCMHLKGTMCMLPQVNKDVSPENGCCNYWDDGSGQPGIKKA